MDIGCYLISNREFEGAKIPEELLIELCKSLRTNGTETVHFANRSILVEGIYIPAKAIKNSLLVVNNEDD
jgi:hypothetical protein